ncbi:MAG: ABC transporter ATP-binding protein [Deltaproteobacteria bacterium]|jgi:peptide/nickel transport system ATP-binding protein|nr:ABC transporter ATP-binding protein [Deltaproteobacteria bacterium]
MIAIEGVTVDFGNGVHVLKDVSLEVPRGRFVCAIGESGSGKSVLLLAILGLLGRGAKVGGRIVVDGTDVLRLPPRALRRFRKERLAYIPQGSGNCLNPLYTIGRQMMDLIRWYLDAPKSEAAVLAESLLRRTGLEDAARVMGAYPFQLSGGMRQRVLAAMGLSGRASVLLLDEPTKGLDRGLVERLGSLFASLTGKTALCVTHDLRFAGEAADDIAVLCSSELLEFCGKDAFFADPLHPYSRAMLASLPENGLKAPPGFAPPRTGPDRAPGCVFEGRCGEATGMCSERPPLFSLGDRKVRCWKHAPSA